LAYCHSIIAIIPTQRNGGVRCSPRRERALMKPIRYNRHQVALMVKIAAHYSVSFAAKVGETRERILEIAAGEFAPPPAVLRHIDLKVEGGSYVWNPR
jgi:hypothetical protein